jgi:hypothetical protein
MTFKKLAVAAIFSLSANICVAAAGATVQPIKLVDQPTAGAFLKGQYGLAFNFFDNGGLAYSYGLGITDRFSIGIAHQLSGAIGCGKIKVQNVPGVLL